MKNTKEKYIWFIIGIVLGAAIIGVLTMQKTNAIDLNNDARIKCLVDGGKLEMGINDNGELFGTCVYYDETKGTIACAEDDYYSGNINNCIPVV